VLGFILYIFSNVSRCIFYFLLLRADYAPFVIISLTIYDVGRPFVKFITLFYELSSVEFLVGSLIVKFLLNLSPGTNVAGAITFTEERLILLTAIPAYGVVRGENYVGYVPLSTNSLVRDYFSCVFSSVKLSTSGTG
jgi:hypothetical protein